MRASSLQSSGFHLQPKNKRPATKRTTAYYIFDKDYQVLFNLDHVSFKARNKTLRVGIISDGSEDDISRLAGEMTPTSGTIMEIVDLYVDGATVNFSDRKVAADVYKRIVNHIEYHLQELRTNISYRPPPIEDFQNMSEFATAIRPWAIDHNPDIDQTYTLGQMQRGLPVRPSFSYALQKTEQEKPEEQKPAETAKSVTRMDALQRLLERIEHGSSR